MPRPIRFEIHADDPERAVKFYGALFGGTFTRWGEESYWQVATGDRATPGIDGGLVPRRSTGRRRRASRCASGAAIRGSSSAPR